MPPPGTAADSDVLTALQRMGLLAAGEQPRIEPLAGGVSSDIVRVELAGGPVCVKRALPKLKVEADWQAPVERNRWEVAWMRTAAAVEPDAVPAVLGEDPQLGMFAMTFLDEKAYPVWKAQLRDGHIDPAFAGEVGVRIVRIHGATAGDEKVRAAFDTDHIFFPIRLEPYLIATGHAHPDLAVTLERLAQRTGAHHAALVHGDISPKNILCGPRGPVFLDAECAWYGDPAFDLAFCLNHMLLKCLWRPQWTTRYLACFEALSARYLDGVTWEPAGEIERRTAQLLPGLFLARVDGKSPAEYVTHEWQRAAVRRVARQFLLQPAQRLASIGSAWQEDAARWPRSDHD
ncbi:MAG: aminoglycoside phosphotransferase family protein [Burkholderiales bacterium]|nr:aminoglycoside phosphotransferase family protein [Burkholderiales bacterium]